ncbi:glycolipid 2-alpha-mannosyltransferase-domain-containing protein [Pyronema domesticum]|uniref:Similar to Probable mannosyltransferase KTR4 acc. no. P38131 n=1 Tax=Pyronema omphalodes (strain CBS 100304) TaxID=1076935 RepID=U4LJT7_PYROM|nr:glycolipid 2-alpha-mannosyltransferase-domain-containing protein [Pyronema domesticum]CCX12897.1 Similar to Probable mannosyltransferase KTR4; acc. no. P38131 [Pyronema omphalodes CBS 100304]
MVLLQPSGARAIFGVLLLTSFLLILYNFSSLSPAVTNIVHAGGNSKFHRPAKGGSLKGIDPLLEPEKGPGGKLWGPGERNRTSATLLSLVRNSELDGILQSMKDLEETWNHKFNYPWTFINDVEFTKEFKEKTQAMTKAECFYHTIPASDWDIPSWIDPELMSESADLLVENGVQYARMNSYHQMCRWNSGRFYHHPALQNYRWYWRVEPGVHFFCDIDYDVFRYMEDNDKSYGFVINIYDSPESIETLWPQTLEFLAEHPEYIHPNNAMGWLTDSKNRPEHNRKANGYSTCHFWSNFEIADMGFWRGEAYEAYFKHLDRAGGFFYERWGDAPVHSIGLGLFEDKDKIHWFRDIGYQHIPYFNCPSSPKCKNRCQAGRFTDGTGLDEEDCRANWFEMAHLD